MKKFIIILLFICSNESFAQSLNDYRYALVPEKFSIFKTKNQFRLNTFTKRYMQNYGFETYYDSELQPIEFRNSNCNKVYLDLIENNTLFFTKIAIVIKDCNGTVLATSNFASSKEKDLELAYSLVLKEAFDTFSALKNYKYNGKIISSDNQIDSKVTNDKTVETKIQNDSKIETNINSHGKLFAQPIPNGYQLIDSEPKIIMRIYNSSIKGVFIAFKGEIQGVLIFKGEDWFFEYYSDAQIKSEKVDVKIN